jgi:hypothetical protein
MAVREKCDEKIGSGEVGERRRPLPSAESIAFLVAYFILLFVDRDALRSERFTLSKLAIEKSVTGDSLRGFTALDIGDQDILPAPAETSEHGERQQ